MRTSWHRAGLAGCLLAGLLGVSVGAPTVAAADGGTGTGTAKRVMKRVNVGGEPLALPLDGSADGEVVFAGATGQVVTVTATATAGFTGACDVKVSLRAPNGTALVAPTCAGAKVALPATALPGVGLYHAVLDVQGSAAGALTVGVTGSGPASITPGAAAVDVTIPAKGQLALAFPMQAGETVGGEVSGYLRNRVTVSVTDDKAIVAGPLRSWSTVTVPPYTAEAAGGRRLRLVNQSASPITASVSVTTGAETTAPLEVGVAAEATLSRSSRAVRFTFATTTTGSPTLSMSSLRLQGYATVTLLDASGKQLWGPWHCYRSGRVTLPVLEPGSYVLRVQASPAQLRPATISLTLGQVVHSTEDVEIGQVVDAAFDGSGGTRSYRVQLMKGDVPVVTASDFAIKAPLPTAASLRAQLFGPDGRVAQSLGTLRGNGSLVGRIAARTDGWYTVRVLPGVHATGTASLTISLVAVTDGAFTRGKPVTLDVGDPAAVYSYALDAHKGQQPIVTVSGRTDEEGYLLLRLVSPSGARSASYYTWTNQTLTLPVLSRWGTWKVTVQKLSGSFSEVTITQDVDTVKHKTLTVGGQTRIHTDTPQYRADYVFQAKAGQVITMTTTYVHWRDGSRRGTVAARLIRPDGTVWGNSDRLLRLDTRSTYRPAGTLDQDGRWVLRVETGPSIGTALVTTTLGAVQQKVLPAGTTTTLTLDVPGGRYDLAFPVAEGQRFGIDSGVPALGGAGYYATLVSPSGEAYDQGSYAGDQDNGEIWQEPWFSQSVEPGTWHLLLQTTGSATGTLPLTLSTYSGSATGTAVSTTAPITGVLGGGGRETVHPMAVQQGRTYFVRVDAGSLAGAGNAPAVYLVPDTTSWWPENVSISAPVIDGSAWVDFTANATATYRVVVAAPFSDAKGGYTVTAGLATTTTASVSPAKPATVDLRAPGTDADVAVAAAPSGSRAQVVVTSPDVGYVAGQLRGTDAGGNAVSADCVPTGTGLWCEFYEGADAVGPFTLHLDPQGPTTGVYTVTEKVVTDLTGTLTPGVATAVDLTATPGRNARFTLPVKAGQHLVLTVTAPSWTGIENATWASVTTMYDTEGYGEGFDATVAGTTESGQPATSDGTWRLVVDPYLSTVGSVTITPLLVSDTSAALPASGPANVTMDRPWVNTRLTPLTLTTRRAVTLSVTGATFEGDVCITYHDSYALACVAVGTTTPDATGTWTFQAGTYDVVVDPRGDATGKATISVT